MRKKAFALALVAILLSLCVYGTVAYFVSEDTQRNVITAGSVSIDLVEKDAEGNDFRNPIGVVPGTAVDKIVTVENTGDNPCWVRISIDKSIELVEGVAGEADLSLVKFDLDLQNWTKQGDFYYYNKPLEAGSSTEPLFRTVIFDKSMGNMYENSTATIVVAAQAVQSQHNDDKVFDSIG